MIYMCLLYVSLVSRVSLSFLGLMFMGSAMLSICRLLLYALFNHLRLLVQVARVQKAQFSYRLDGLVP